MLASDFDPTPTGNRKWYLFAGAATVAIVVVVAAVLLIHGGGDSTAGPAASTTTQSLTQATPPGRPPTLTPTPVSVAPARLPQLLLPADAISTTLSSPGMLAEALQSSIDPVLDTTVVPLDCSSTWAPGKMWTYQLSGYIGMARQTVAERPSPAHAVVQAVMAFPDGAGAKKSYADQVKAWGQCQNQQVTATQAGAPKPQTAVIGAFAEADGVATLQVTPDIGLPGVSCQRALTVVGNVVVDVRSCSPNVGDTAATIARDIAAKITAGR